MKSFFRNEYLLISLLFINMVFGLLTLGDYGESWDEEIFFQYADRSISAYKALLDPSIQVMSGHPIFQFYGPAYLMVSSLLTKGFEILFPNTPVVELWHINNFLCLQIGLVCFYYLARRFTDRISAITATALMSSQPLIWGHGFINPKDIPLMAFFTASILFGLKMLDIFEANNFELKKLLTASQFYIAAITLGLTISIRPLGLAAGFVILFYLACIDIKKVLRFSYAYYGCALVVTFLTWPYLWASPIKNFLTTISFALKFLWPGYTLFDGVFYHPDQIPRFYAPKLFAMQLTEIAIILLFAGLFIIFLPAFRGKYRRLFILLVPWFIFPALYILTFNMRLFDNLRHLLFLYPSAFLIMVIPIELILSWVNAAGLRILIIFGILFPGILGLVQYHPFEYIYYNSIARSTNILFRHYDTDYWTTSYKQAATWLNENAPENAHVLVWGPDNVVRHYVRDDIQVQGFDLEYNFQDIDQKELTEIAYLSIDPYYVVLSSRWDIDLHILPEIDPVYSFRFRDADLCVIKYIEIQK